MPRRAREMSPWNMYHVVIKGTDSQRIFESDEDCLKYLEILAYYKKECKFKLLTFCLMGNHVHLVVWILGESLSTVFRKINTCYATWYNMKYQRSGPVQDGRFFSRPIVSERQLIEEICYVHYNPIKAGLEKRFEDGYRWSGYRAFEKGYDDLVDVKDTLKLFGGAKAFRKAHKQYDDAKVKGLDIEQRRKRIPDDVAQQIVVKVSGCKNVTEFQKLPLLDRDIYIQKIRKMGLSIGQINRVTGVSKGKIMRILGRA